MPDLTPDLTVAEFAAALGYGDDVTERAATLRELLDPIQEALSAAHDHDDCPYICEDCGEPLATTRCVECQGSGCGPGTALGAYDPCGYCDGVGKVHVGCVGLTYAELAEEVRRLRAAVAAVDAIEPWWPYNPSTMRGFEPDEAQGYNNALAEVRRALHPEETTDAH